MNSRSRNRAESHRELRAAGGLGRRGLLIVLKNAFIMLLGPLELNPMLQKRIDDQPSISQENIREAEGILHQHLKKVGLKHTEQRDTILRTFLDTREHLSTDELHRLVKQKDPKIGFTTVYRTLKLLAECGLASEVAFHDGIARYEHQYNRRSHNHMVCTECGSSVEFFSPEVGELEQSIGRKYRYVTTRHTFQIYGICEDCRKNSSSRNLV
jgi:Fur family ferric uptake transcriptional regulator